MASRYDRPMACLPSTTATAPAGSGAAGQPITAGAGLPFLAAAGKLTFTWSATPATAGLIIRLIEESTGAVVGEIDPAPASGTVTWTLPAAGKYAVWLATVAICGVGANHAYCAQTVKYSFSGACAGPPTPANLRVSSRTSTALTMVCDASAGADDYDWYLDGKYTKSTASPTWTFSGLAPSSTHTIAVYACITGVLCNIAPAQISATTSPASTPPPPTCPSCPECQTCSNPEVGCVPIICPTGESCLDGTCQAIATPPAPKSSNEALVIGAAVAVVGVGGLVVWHSRRPVVSAPGQRRRRRIR
jgi:hypothetical protein